MVDKFIRDGQVAVLVSYGFGAGWSSWAGGDAEKMLFDPDIVQAVLDADVGKAMELAEKKYPDAYLGGLEDVGIRWVPVGTSFYIHEYDGAESMRFREDDNWIVA